MFIQTYDFFFAKIISWILDFLPFSIKYLIEKIKQIRCFDENDKNFQRLQKNCFG
ncbi:hypothetical protein Hanom_Chr02g00138801 [Helianthus anomalus]